MSPAKGRDVIQEPGDVDPLRAPVGDRFVIQQHHATALHHDFRLEMVGPDGPVLASWAVPKGLPRERGTRHLAIRTPDHSMEHLDYEGAIPDDEYGGGVVRIYDRGTYEMRGRTDDRITFEIDGQRLRGVWHLISTGPKDGKEQWLALLSEDLRQPADPMPSSQPMEAGGGEGPFDDSDWLFEPRWPGLRALAFCDGETRLLRGNGSDVSERFPELSLVDRHLIAREAVVDGVIVAFEDGLPSSAALEKRLTTADSKAVADLARRSPVVYMAFDLLYLDGGTLVDEPLEGRRRLLEEAIVPAPWLQLSPATEGTGTVLSQAVTARGLDGIVAKRKGSPYRSGASEAWLEV
jgi:bifunctional non-homologous end joining protein LigD